jgi:hypothetical protein
MSLKRIGIRNENTYFLTYKSIQSISIDQEKLSIGFIFLVGSIDSIETILSNRYNPSI